MLREREKFYREHVDSESTGYFRLIGEDLSKEVTFRAGARIPGCYQSGEGQGRHCRERKHLLPKSWGENLHCVLDGQWEAQGARRLCRRPCVLIRDRQPKLDPDKSDHQVSFSQLLRGCSKCSSLISTLLEPPTLKSLAQLYRQCHLSFGKFLNL